MLGERTGVRVLSAVAPAAALAVDPWGWYPFGPIKWLLIPTLALAGAALVLRDRPLRVPVTLACAAGGLVAWMALAAAMGEDPLYAWIGTPERRFGVLTWALCALLLALGCSLHPRRDGPTLVTGLLVAGGGVGLVATLEAVGWEPDVLDVGSRLTGTFGSSAYLGAASALLLPIALGVALDHPREPVDIVREEPRRTSTGSRGGAAVVAGLLAVACLGSGARGAWLGLGAAAVLAAVIGRRSVVAAVRAHRRRVLTVAGATLVGAALLLVASPVGDRLSDLGDPGSAGGQGRLDEWEVGARVLGDHLLVGVGPEGYRTVFHEGIDRAYAVEHGREVQPDRAHDGPLDIALAGGLPGLVAWLAVVAVVGRAAWAALRDGPGWLAGVAAGVVAHWVGQLVLFPVVELEPVVWLLGGLLVAARAPAVVWRWVERPLPRVGAAVLVLGAIVALASGITEVAADHRADDASTALARGDALAATEAADDAADLRPDVVRLHLLAARAAVAADRGFAVALDHVEDALDVSPRDPIALLARATYLVARAEATGTEGHRTAALLDVKARIVADPLDPRLWALQGRLAAAAGDEAGAAHAERQAEALAPEADR